MTGWTLLTDDDFSDDRLAAVASFASAAREWGAGTATGTPRDSDGRRLAIISVAEIAGRQAAVFIDLSDDEDPSPIWLEGPADVDELAMTEGDLGVALAETTRLRAGIERAQRVLFRGAARSEDPWGRINAATALLAELLEPTDGS